MTGSPAPARRFAGRPDAAPPGYVPGEEDLPLDVLRAPSRAGGLWLLKAASGVLLIGFLGLHLLAQHFFVEGGLRDYAAVVAYLRHPLAIAAEMGLLGSVIVHAALGVRAVVVDLLGNRALRLVSWVLGAAALGAFAYGIGITLIVIGG